MGRAGSALLPCLGVQIQGCMVWFSWYLNCCVGYNDVVCIMHGIIRGEHRCAVALLWHRHAPSCGLAIGSRHHVSGHPIENLLVVLDKVYR